MARRLLKLQCRTVGSWRAGGQLASAPYFEKIVSAFSIRGGRGYYVLLNINYPPHEFSDLPTALQCSGGVRWRGAQSIHPAARPVFWDVLRKFVIFIGFLWGAIHKWFINWKVMVTCFMFHQSWSLASLILAQSLLTSNAQIAVHTQVMKSQNNIDYGWPHWGMNSGDVSSAIYYETYHITSSKRCVCRAGGERSENLGEGCAIINM